MDKGIELVRTHVSIAVQNSTHSRSIHALLTLLKFRHSLCVAGFLISIMLLFMEPSIKVTFLGISMNVLFVTWMLTITFKQNILKFAYESSMASCSPYFINIMYDRLGTPEKDRRMQLSVLGLTLLLQQYLATYGEEL